MSLNFIHFSDSHLGFSDLDKQNSEGVNIREQDFYDSFTQITDKIIQAKPSFAVHTGDLFHRASPTNRTIVFALEQIKRISNAGIPLFIIAGNHDFPKSVFTTPIHHVFSGIHGVKIFFDESYNTLETDDYVIHALPHINEEKLFLEECCRIQISNKAKPNFLFMHVSVGRSYLMDEFGERIFPSELLSSLGNFNYVGLGHWHRFQQLHSYDNVYYSGSTERLSEKEAGDRKGCVHVTLNGKTEIKFNEVNLRTFERIEIKNCCEKLKEEIISELKAFYTANADLVKDSIITVQLTGLDPSQLYSVSSKEINEIFPGSMHINVLRSVKDSGEIIMSSASACDLREQLSSEMRKSFIDDNEFLKVQQLTMNLLSDLEEEEANANQ